METFNRYTVVIKDFPDVCRVFRPTWQMMPESKERFAGCETRLIPVAHEYCTFGGARRFVLVEGEEAVEVSDEVATWRIANEANLDLLICESGSSGSRLTAERRNNGEWLVTLDLPIIDGQEYRGRYAKSFFNM